MDRTPGIFAAPVFGIGMLVVLAAGFIKPSKSPLQQLCWFLLLGYLNVMTFGAVGVATDNFYTNNVFQIGLRVADLFASPMLMACLTLHIFSDYGARLLPVGSDFMMFLMLVGGVLRNGGAWPGFWALYIMALFYFLITLFGLFMGDNLDVVIAKFKSNSDKTSPSAAKFKWYGLLWRFLFAGHRIAVLILAALSPEAFAVFPSYTWPFWIGFILVALQAVMAFLLRPLLTPISDELAVTKGAYSSIDKEETKANLLGGQRDNAGYRAGAF